MTSACQPHPRCAFAGCEMPGEPCRCLETSPAPDAFDGIYHWRADCPYLNDAEKRAVRDCYGEPDEALRKWREQHVAP